MNKCQNLSELRQLLQAYVSYIFHHSYMVILSITNIKSYKMSPYINVKREVHCSVIFHIESNHDTSKHSNKCTGYYGCIRWSRQYFYLSYIRKCDDTLGGDNSEYYSVTTLRIPEPVAMFSLRCEWLIGTAIMIATNKMQIVHCLALTRYIR